MLLRPRKSFYPTRKIKTAVASQKLISVLQANQRLFRAGILNTGLRSATDAHSVDTGSLVSGITVSLARVGVRDVGDSRCLRDRCL